MNFFRFVQYLFPQKNHYYDSGSSLILQTAHACTNFSRSRIELLNGHDVVSLSFGHSKLQTLTVVALSTPHSIHLMRHFLSAQSMRIGYVKCVYHLSI